MRVIICGGGIIGCSIAYYLSLKGVSATVVERCEVACGASGKAGGFLAKDWCDSYELGDLARKSFEMHAELAEIFQGTDYRKLDTLGIEAQEGHAGKTKVLGAPDWLDGVVLGVASPMGDKTTTAQVNPAKLTKSLMDSAKQNGATLHIGAVEGVQLSSDKTKVTGVLIKDQDPLPCDVMVVAMGPWSSQASQWFPAIPPISGRRAHSVIIKPKTPVTATALFMEYRLKKGESKAPEVYPRPDGEVYVCGMGDHHPLPEEPDKVEHSQDSCNALFKMAADISSSLANGDLKASRACYLPLSPDGLPLIGKIPSVEGAYIATGHSCWGILNAPMTGKVMADLIVDGKCNTVDVTPFDPDRFHGLGVL